MSTPVAADAPHTTRPLPVSRNGTQIGMLALLLSYPWLPGASEYLGMGIQAAVFTVIAASLVLLTGWVGQISLGHAALVGIGGYATGWAAGALGLTFPLSLPVAAAMAAVVAAGLGVVALRVRGLYLAVATLVFSWTASEFLFRQGWLTAHGALPGGQAIGPEGSLLYLDFGGTETASQRTLYYAAWIVTVALLYALLNLRDSRSGRAMFAIRGSEMAAASLGMDVLRYKLLAFALSGALAGIAGNLMMTGTLSVSPASFDFERSLFFLAIAVVGGLTSLAGAVAAGWLFAGMEELFFQVLWLNPYLGLAGAVMLAAVFRVYPGGLATLGSRAWEGLRRLGGTLRRLPGKLARRSDDVGADEPERGRVLPIVGAPFRVVGHLGRQALVGVGRRRAVRERRREQRPQASTFLDLDASDLFAADPAASTTSTNGQRPEDALEAEQRATRARLLEVSAARAPDPATRDQLPALIDASHITVRFGGLTAVDDANLTVREGEICGLIGPNGAGKTTLFNSIAGFNRPTEGTVSLYGHDVTGMPVHRRAQLGVSRTFQIIQLFSELTVFDNLLAATHLQNPTGFLQHMAVTHGALVAEVAARERVQKVVDLLGLHDVARRPVAGLPFGTLRMIEVARALVSGAKVIMLDEPASGLDEHETDQLTEVLRVVRGLGATLLLIEHDVRMVTAVTDYMYVLERGRIIAEGPPAQIKDDPAVITAYLGGAVDGDGPDATAAIQARADVTDELPAVVVVDDTAEVRG